MKRRADKPVDLARVRAAEERLDRVLAEHPEIAERAARMFRGDLACAEMDEEGPMDDTTMRTIPVRLPPAMVDRLDALVPLVQADPTMAALGKVSRSDVMRLAFMHGLEKLEAAFGEGSERAPQDENQ